MTLYLLDRSVVVDIQHYNRKGVSKNNVINVARALDKPGCYVTPILSAMEAQLGDKPSILDVHDCLKSEVFALGVFFKRAKVDNALQERYVEACLAMVSETMRETDTYKAATAKLQQQLAHQNSKDEAKDYFATVKQTAGEFGLGLANPLIACAIASVYGNVSARKLLKLGSNRTEADAYNAMMDISKIKMTAYIQHIALQAGVQERVELVTRDRPLSTMAKIFRPVATSNMVVAGEADYFQSSFYGLGFVNNLPFLSKATKAKETLVAEMSRPALT